MSWAAFWLPNLLQATLFAAVSAIVGAVVGLVARWWFRKYIAPMLTDLFAEQQRTTTAAKEAATASAGAKGAADMSQASQAEVQAAVVYLAEELGRTRAALEITQRKRDVEAARNDEVFAALLLAKTPPVPETTGGLLVPFDAGDEDDPATVTGRHRLHTQHVQTIDEGDHP